MKDRTEKQLEEIINWQQSKILHNAPNNGCGTLNWVTGVGKTFASCTIINKVLTKDTEGFALVLAPYDILVKQWTEEVKRLCYKVADRVKIMTVQYYVMNNLFLSPVLLVLDELDEFYSEERIKIINKKKCDYKFGLGLTATFEEKRKRHLEVEKYLPIVSIITEDEAIKNKWISNFVEYNLSVPFTEQEKEDYDKLSSAIAVDRGKFYDFNHAVRVLTGDGGKSSPIQLAIAWAKHMGWKPNMDLSITANKDINDLWNPKTVIGYANRLLENVRKRNNLLELAENKFIYALDVIRKYKDVKTITFSQSTIFADKLHYLINKEFSVADLLGEKTIEYAVLYHSNIETKVLINEKTGKPTKFGSKRLKDLAINAIKTGVSRVIVTAKALDKGFDVKDIRLGIITSGSDSYNQHKQRGGRMKRIEDIPYEHPVLIINLYCEGSKEESSLISRQKKGTNKVTWIDSVEQIVYQPLQKTKLKMIE
jgi:superfamily II DNA or RNA helicase